MVEELKAAIERASATTDLPSWDDDKRFSNAMSAQFLRDHGQALVEAVENSERYREALQNIAELSDSGCALEEIAFTALHPVARTKAGAGGGA